MKTITSPIKRFPGTVNLFDPLTLPQAIGMERALAKVNELRDNGDATKRELNYALLPGICGCLDGGDIKGWPGLSPDTFPATPQNASAELLAWIIGEVVALYQDTDDIPNE